MKKTIGAVLIATLMGSLSANATVILSDDFTVTGGASADINTEWNTRQSGTSLTPWSVDGGAGDILDPLFNGGTARVAGTLNGPSSMGMIQNNWMTGMDGEEWEATFLANAQVDGATWSGGWFGFGISSEVYSANAPWGDFGAIHREGGNITIFSDSAGVVAIDTGWDPFSSIIKYKLVADEVAGTLALSYDAYDATTLALLGHEDVIAGAIAFDGANRGIDFRLNADNTIGDSVAGFLIDDLLVETIPEPATLGLFAIFGGAALFIRKKIMI